MRKLHFLASLSLLSDDIYQYKQNMLIYREATSTHLEILLFTLIWIGLLEFMLSPGLNNPKIKKVQQQ